MIKRMVFVAMPFGVKRDLRQSCDVDFDRIYEIGIKPALERFGDEIEYVRADEERSGGIIHQPMFERLLLAEIAIVDVTLENANVFYELGVRHASRGRTTIILRGGEGGLPFDISMMRAVLYQLDRGTLSDESAQELIAAIAARLETALASLGQSDSPLFQLIHGYPGIALPKGTADAFRERVQQGDQLRSRLAAARSQGAAGLPAIVAIESELGRVTEANFEPAIDVALSYRDLGAFEQLIAFVEKIPKELRERSVQLRQQFALALNRRNRDSDRHDALALLEALCGEGGDTAETCGIIGRLYKDHFIEARRRKERSAARGYLKSAIDYYRRGFNADPREHFPGVNLVTLLTIEGSGAARVELAALLPTVAFAARRSALASPSDYWTIATQLELAVLANQWDAADDALAQILGMPKLKPFELQSTTRQLGLLRTCEPPTIDLAKLDEVLVEMVVRLPAAAASEIAEFLPAAALAAIRSDSG